MVRYIDAFMRLSLLSLVGVATMPGAQEGPSPQTEIAIPPQTAAPDAPRCEAEIALEYLQWNTVVRVEGTLTNDQCAASSGEYTIEARLRDERGELRTLEFNESWRRDDAQPVRFMKEYPLGENVELLRVRTRRVSCVCTHSPAE